MSPCRCQFRGLTFRFVTSGVSKFVLLSQVHVQPKDSLLCFYLPTSFVFQRTNLLAQLAGKVVMVKTCRETKPHIWAMTKYCPSGHLVVKAVRRSDKSQEVHELRLHTEKCLKDYKFLNLPKIVKCSRCDTSEPEVLRNSKQTAKRWLRH